MNLNEMTKDEDVLAHFGYEGETLPLFDGRECYWFSDGKHLLFSTSIRSVLSHFVSQEEIDNADFETKLSHQAIVEDDMFHEADGGVLVATNNHTLGKEYERVLVVLGEHRITFPGAEMKTVHIEDEENA